jgi:hypothetical protein
MVGSLFSVVTGLAGAPRVLTFVFSFARFVASEPNVAEPNLETLASTSQSGCDAFFVSIC